MWVRKSRKDGGHITSGRRGIGVFWQQWVLSLCSPREPEPGSVTVSSQERSSYEAELASFPCEQTCTSPAMMAPEDLGARTSIHPAADCQEGDSFSTSRVHRAGLSGTGPQRAKWTPRAQRSGSFGTKNVCYHLSQFNYELSVGDKFLLTLYKGKDSTTPPFTNLDVVQVFSFLPGIFPILKIQASNEVDWLCAEVPSHGMSCLYIQERNDT